MFYFGGSEVDVATDSVLLAASDAEELNQLVSITLPAPSSPPLMTQSKRAVRSSFLLKKPLLHTFPRQWLWDGKPRLFIHPSPAEIL